MKTWFPLWRYCSTRSAVLPVSPRLKASHVEEDRLVFPLPRLLVLLAVVDREAELGDLAAVGEHRALRDRGSAGRSASPC